MYTAIFIALIVIAIIYRMGKAEHLKTLKRQYEDALKGSDKRTALEAGRNYYSALRKGKILIHDEQAITNDLSTMLSPS